jgi:hypothetical protein
VQSSTPPPPSSASIEGRSARAPAQALPECSGSSARRCAPDLPRNRRRNLPPREQRARGKGPDELAPYGTPALRARRRGGACLRPCARTPPFVGAELVSALIGRPQFPSRPTAVLRRTSARKSFVSLRIHCGKAG